MEYEDPYHLHAPWLPRSKVKVTWCGWQMLAGKSKMKLIRNTKVGRKVADPTGNNVHQFPGQRSRSPGWLLLRQEVRHIFRAERPTNLKLDTQTEYEDPYRRQAPLPSRSVVKVAMSSCASDRQINSRVPDATSETIQQMSPCPRYSLFSVKYSHRGSACSCTQLLWSDLWWRTNIYF